MLGNAPHAQCADHQEPQRHDWPESIADPRGPLRLNGEQPNQHRHGRGQHVSIEGGRHDLQSFQRREHRDRRRDGAVAIDQGGAEQANGHYGGALAAFHAEQRHQSENAAFAIVVDAHGDVHILDGRDDDQCPDHQRQRTEHGERIGPVARKVQHRLEGVQRARTDIPEYHPERGKTQRRQGS